MIRTHFAYDAPSGRAPRVARYHSHITNCGEFGNDTWAIRRAAGFADKVNYRDWRILLGLERKSIGRMDRHIEVGYVFSRRLHYDSMRPEFPLNDAFMIRAGLTY